MQTRPEPHVAWRRLVDRHDRRLSPRLASAAEAHLASGCATCATDARLVERLIAAIGDGPLEAPPRAAEREAAALLRSTYLAFAQDAGLVVGVLLLDRTDESAALLRAAAGETRRLLWTVGGYEVDASLVARAGGTDVLAQIVPGGDDPDARVAGEVAARRGDAVTARAAIAPDGRFTFRALARGLYTFEGRVDGMRFVLPPLHVE